MELRNIVIIFNIIIVFISIIFRLINGKNEPVTFKSFYKKELRMFFSIFIMYFLVREDQTSLFFLEILFLAYYIYEVRSKANSKLKGQN